MQDEKMNADMKRALRGAFSAKNVQNYDSEVDKQILALKTRISEDGTVPLMELLAQYQMDFFMKVAFGETSNFMEQRTPTKQFSIVPRAKHWHRFQGLPKLEEFLFQNRIANMFTRKQKPPAWSTYASAAIKARKEISRAGEKTDDQKNDLLDKYIQARQTHAHLFDDEALNRMVSSTISAGFDTVGHDVPFASTTKSTRRPAFIQAMLTERFCCIDAIHNEQHALLPMQEPTSIRETQARDHGRTPPRKSIRSAQMERSKQTAIPRRRYERGHAPLSIP